MLGRIGRFLRNVVRPSGVVKGRENVQAHQGTVAEASGSSGLAGLTKDEFVRQRGQTQLGDVTVTKETDRSTPDLAGFVCGGRNYEEVEIDLGSSTSPGSTGQDPARGYTAYEIQNSMVTGFDVSGDDGKRPDEIPPVDLGSNSGTSETEKPTRAAGPQWSVADDPDE